MVKKILFVLVAAFIAFAIINCAGQFTLDKLDWKVNPNKDVQQCSALLAGAAALGTAAAGIGSSLFNLFQQEKYSAKQEQLIREQWSRDDNAVQRRAVDLKAAGLSKTLAAGSAAGNSVVSAPNAPQMDNVGGKLQDAISAAMGIQQIMNAREENANLRTSRQVMASTIAENMAKAQLFNNQSNKVVSDIGLNNAQVAHLLQMDNESKARSATYGWNIKKTQQEIQGLYYKSLIDALDADLIGVTGLGHNSGSLPAVAAKLVGRSYGSVMELLNRGKVNQVINYAGGM